MVRKVLSRPTLVLNRNWQPIAVSTVARALTKVFLGTALVVDPEDYQLYSWEDWAAIAPADDEEFISSQWLRLRIPEVISLVKYDRLPLRSVAFNRRNLFSRDRYTCQYCGSQPGMDQLTIDHVVPRSQQGGSSWENCVLACLECNHKKANRTPDQARMPLRRKPVQPRWKPMYAGRDVRIDSWGKFLSEAYWNVSMDAD